MHLATLGTVFGMQSGFYRKGVYGDWVMEKP